MNETERFHKGIGQSTSMIWAALDVYAEHIQEKRPMDMDLSMFILRDFGAALELNIERPKIVRDWAQDLSDLEIEELCAYLTKYLDDALFEEQVENVRLAALGLQLGCMGSMRYCGPECLVNVVYACRRLKGNMMEA